MIADVIALPAEPGVDELGLVVGNVEQLGRYRPTDNAGRVLKALNAVQLNTYLARIGRRAHPSNR